MTSQEKAMIEIAGTLSNIRVPYMVIGGMANALWGVARNTVDVDVTVWVDDKEIEGFIRKLREKFAVLPGNPEEFVRDKRVLPIKTSNNVKVYLIFGLIPYEKEAIGIINDESNDIGSVHFGIVFRVTASDKNVTVREVDQLVGEWISLKALKEMKADKPDSFETWSALIIDKL